MARNPFKKHKELWDDIQEWQNLPMVKPLLQDKYLFSDGLTYYAELCKILKLLSYLKESTENQLEDVNITGDGITTLDKTLEDNTLNIELQIEGGGGSGSVSRVNTGTGLTGGPITTTGTISVDFDVIPSKEDLDNYIVKEDAPGYTDILTQTDAQSIYETKSTVSSLEGRITAVEGDIDEISEDIVNLEADKIEDVNITGTGITVVDKTITNNTVNIELAVSGSAGGTVTSVGTGSGLTGGPITSAGTISVDFTTVASKDDLDDYIVKEDAPGYTDILTQTDAQSIYETKSTVSSLEGRITAVEGDIDDISEDIVDINSSLTSLGSRVTDAEGNIISITSRVTTNEGNISSLTTRVTNAESNITSLNSSKQDKLSSSQISNINRALVTPLTTPVQKQMTGVDTTNSQMMINIGNGLELDGNTSPYTLQLANDYIERKYIAFTIEPEEWEATTYLYQDVYVYTKTLEDAVSGRHPIMSVLFTNVPNMERENAIFNTIFRFEEISTGLRIFVTTLPEYSIQLQVVDY